jgi:hypothetical protein
MRTSFVAIVVLTLSISGCPGTSTPADGGTDGDGDRIDAPTGMDAGGDGGGVDGGGTDTGGTDTPSGTDGGGTDTPGSGCPAGLGFFCEGMGDCPSGYECNVGRCAPQGRPLCGGFAGAECTEPAFPSCLYFRSADFGPCLTAAEASCICGDPARAAGFVCP